MKNNDEELQRMFEQTDKWLAPYYNGIAEGENRERERIIKLLEELIENRTEINLRGAIILIKGENK
jgi:hypothetical protein